MTINTGISSSLRRPQTFHTFTYQQGGRSLVPLPQRLLLIGTMKGGTAVAGTIYQINDPRDRQLLRRRHAARADVPQGVRDERVPRPRPVSLRDGPR
jgi:hypothetical protein